MMRCKELHKRLTQLYRYNPLFLSIIPIPSRRRFLWYPKRKIFGLFFNRKTAKNLTLHGKELVFLGQPLAGSATMRVALPQKKHRFCHVGFAGRLVRFPKKRCYPHQSQTWHRTHVLSCAPSRLSLSQLLIGAYPHSKT